MALRTVRLAAGNSGWRRYQVLDDEQSLGIVVEHHEWTGTRWGGRRWLAAHNPLLSGSAACWCSPALMTRAEAVEALSVHLARSHDQFPVSSDGR